MRRVLIATLSVFALALSGCGGDDHATPARELTKVEYVRAVKAVDASAERMARSTQGGTLRARARGVLKYMQRLIEGLEALHPPAEARRAHADFVASIRDIFALRRPILDATLAGDEAKAQRLTDETYDEPHEIDAEADRARRFFLSHGYDLGVAGP